MSGQQMEFPETFEKFAEDFGIKDVEEVYTNGIDLIPIYRVKQWLEHDNKLRTIETNTAYECGKHANKWIPCSERLPNKGDAVLATTAWGDVTIGSWDETKFMGKYDWTIHDGNTNAESDDVIAWMPLPKPYEPRESEDWACKGCWCDDGEVHVECVFCDKIGGEE